MNKTYSEQHQAALFRAAREIRAIAGQVLDDMQNDVELTSQPTHIWARSTAKHYAEKAYAMEEEAHEIAIASSRQETSILKSKSEYSTKIDAYETRRTKAQGRKLAEGREPFGSDPSGYTRV